LFETDATVLVGFVGLIAVLLHYVGFSVQRFFDSCFSVIDAPLSIDDTAEVVPL
jgi:hypothetical protein